MPPSKKPEEKSKKSVSFSRFKVSNVLPNTVNEQVESEIEEAMERGITPTFVRRTHELEEAQKRKDPLIVIDRKKGPRIFTPVTNDRFSAQELGLGEIARQNQHLFPLVSNPARHLPALHSALSDDEDANETLLRHTGQIQGNERARELRATGQIHPSIKARAKIQERERRQMEGEETASKLAQYNHELVSSGFLEETPDNPLQRGRGGKSKRRRKRKTVSKRSRMSKKVYRKR